jgi:hypothetical protein
MPLEEGFVVALLRALGHLFIALIDLAWWCDILAILRYLVGLTGTMTAWVFTLGRSGWDPEEPRAQALGALVILLAIAFFVWLTL